MRQPSLNESTSGNNGKDNLETVKIAGLRISTIGMIETAKLLCLHGSRNRSISEEPYVHTSVNGQVVWLAEKDRNLYRFLQSADVVSCDSQPMVLFSKIFSKNPFYERVATTDLIHVVAERSQYAGISFFLLGGTEVENKKSAQNLSLLYPGINIVGRRNGYFCQSEEKSICNTISAARPDILWVGMGVPLEQRFIERCASLLPTVGAIKTCGGCFKILSGELPRPWKIFQIMGLEWLIRLLLEPNHVAFRYIVSTPMAIWLAMKKMDRK